jgi:hypothetical protein
VGAGCRCSQRVATEGGGKVSGRKVGGQHFAHCAFFELHIGTTLQSIRPLPAACRPAAASSSTVEQAVVVVSFFSSARGTPKLSLLFDFRTVYLLCCAPLCAAPSQSTPLR